MQCYSKTPLDGTPERVTIPCSCRRLPKMMLHASRYAARRYASTAERYVARAEKSKPPPEKLNF